MSSRYQVRIDSRVARELRRIEELDAGRILVAIESLEDNPRPPGVVKLVHRPGWRLRIGAYRILYEIDDEKKLVTVYRAGHRRDVYR